MGIICKYDIQDISENALVRHSSHNGKYTTQLHGVALNRKLSDRAMIMYTIATPFSFVTAFCETCLHFPWQSLTVSQWTLALSSVLTCVPILLLLSKTSYFPRTKVDVWIFAVSKLRLPRQLASFCWTLCWLSIKNMTTVFGCAQKRWDASNCNTTAATPGATRQLSSKNVAWRITGTRA